MKAISVMASPRAAAGKKLARIMKQATPGAAPLEGGFARD
jgi:hypothetical protein